MPPRYFGRGKHLNLVGVGFGSPTDAFNDVPLFKPGITELDTEPIFLTLSYPASNITQALVLNTQLLELSTSFPNTALTQALVLSTTSKLLNLSLPASDFKQSQRLDSSEIILSLTFLASILENPGILNTDALLLSIAYPVAQFGQGQTLITAPLTLSITQPATALVQPLRLNTLPIALSVSMPITALGQGQSLISESINLTISQPATAFNQNQRLVTTALTLPITQPITALDQNQRLETTALTLTVTQPGATLSQLNLITTPLSLSIVQPTTTLFLGQLLNTTPLNLSVETPAATITQALLLETTPLALTVSTPATSLTQAGGVTESISETRVDLRTSQLQDITVMGDVDWWIAGVDEKSGGTAITVAGGTIATSTGAPVFKFSDGTTNTGDQQLTSQYQFGSTPPLATIAIPAGFGRVSVWVGTGSVNDASVQASFGSNFTGIVNFSNDDRFDIDFVAASATTMAVTISAGSNADAGFYAVALATDAILTGTPAPDILWWPTTEATGTNIYDPINGWIGFFEGTTISWDTDNFLLFAGGYVRNNNGALESLIETTSTGTAMCWVNPNDLTNDACIFTAKNNTTNEGRMYFLRGDPSGASGGGTNVYKGGYRTDPTSGAQGTQFESANNDWALGWNHIAMSFATGSEALPRFQFWKNGVLLPQANYTFYPTQFPDNTIHSQGNFIYGQQGNRGNPFSGKLYDLRLYEAELTTAQIQQIYDATKGVVGVT